jgi:hypothetical protein
MDNVLKKAREIAQRIPVSAEQVVRYTIAFTNAQMCIITVNEDDVDYDIEGFVVLRERVPRLKLTIIPFAAIQFICVEIFG